MGQELILEKCRFNPKIDNFPRFTKVFDGEGESSFRLRRKFPSGMTGEITFWFSETNRDKFVEVSLVIYNKRSEAWRVDGALTGRDNLYPLIWAKKVILGLDGYIIKNFNISEFTLEINADDDKRFRAYKKVLQPNGFLVSHDGKKRLYKIVMRSSRDREPEKYCYYC